MKIKKIVVRCILCVQMGVLVYLYFFEKNGLQMLSVQKKERVALEMQLKQLQKEIDALEAEMYVWQTDDFYKEKIAREQLQMARKGDKLFYIGS